MTDQPHPDVLGLRASLPAPGWTVLDTARDQRFTGELRASTDHGVEYRVYVDRGEVYCAERATDPSLGTRLVEAGAINAAQLDYGALRIGDIEHLGRLFDRVPSINRDAVFVLNQMMTEETMRAMASRSIVDVDATPYRHHPSGMHRWTTLALSRTPAPWGELPELALPAPPPDARPVSEQEPAPAPTIASTSGATESTATPDTTTATETAPPQATPTEQHSTPEAPTDLADDLFDDDVVQWDEPSLLVGTASVASSAATTHERRELFPTRPPLGATDWVDELGPDGVADAPAAPARYAKLPSASVPPAEQFEVIWPSGEVDDLASPGPADGDHVASPHTARPDDAASADAAAPDTDEPDVTVTAEPESAETRPSTGRVPDGVDDADEPTGGDPAADEPPDDSLAVRRAVATIDTGSLAVRRRLASPGDDLPTPPGRLIVGRDHHTAWRNGNDRPTSSVFDAQPAEVVPEPDEPPTPDDQERRAGALRRLIGSLRKSGD